MTKIEKILKKYGRDWGTKNIKKVSKFLIKNGYNSLAELICPKRK